MINSLTMTFEINLQQLAVVCFLLFAEYALVLASVIADLISGRKKAKQRGELRTSYGYRRTVDKLGRYYLPLFALTVVDIMQMIAIWYLNYYHDTNIPLLPIMTLIGAIGIGLIEIKSILEKSDEKDRRKLNKNLKDLSILLENKDDILKGIAGVLKNQVQQNKEEDGIEKTTN